MSETVYLLVGTMSGTAEFVADELLDVLRASGYVPIVKALGSCTAESLDEKADYIVVCSTYGEGDVPDSAKPFLSDLRSSSRQLRQLKYSVLALGDRAYPSTFCNGGKQFDAAFRERGATPRTPLKELDAGSGIYPEEAAVEWLRGVWLASVTQSA